MASSTSGSPQFQSAAQYVASSPKASKASNATKLELYALFKYLTVSHKPNTSRPSIFDMTGRAKWDAWNKGTTEWAQKSDSELEERYIEIAKEFGWTPDASITDSSDIKGEIAEEEEGGKSGGGGLGLTVSSIARPPEELDFDESTLHGVVLANDPEKVLAFLKSNPNTDIDAKDEFGFTALHLAADRGFLPVVKALVNKGANIGIKDPDGHTALALAKVADHEDIIAYLDDKLESIGEVGQGA